MSAAPTAGESTHPAPSSCPFCRSDRVSTTAKSITEETYWRCEGCGQVWNPARLQNSPSRRWRV